MDASPQLNLAVFFKTPLARTAVFLTQKDGKFEYYGKAEIPDPSTFNDEVVRLVASDGQAFKICQHVNHLEDFRNLHKKYGTGNCLFVETMTEVEAAQRHYCVPIIFDPLQQ